MKIEDEIRSDNFEDNFQKAAINVNYTSGWLNNVVRSEFGKFNLTSQQFNILRILRGQHPEPASINLLKERMIDKMSDASRIVDRLAQKDLVLRHHNAKDRRLLDVSISEHGLDILAQMDIEFKPWEFLNSNLTEQEVGALNDLLDKMRG